MLKWPFRKQKPEVPSTPAPAKKPGRPKAAKILSAEPDVIHTGKCIHWPEWEPWLRENYPVKGAPWCAEELSRLMGREVAVTAARTAANRLGLKVNPEVRQRGKAEALGKARAGKAAKRAAAPLPPVVVATDPPRTLCKSPNGPLKRKVQGPPPAVELSAADAIRKSGNCGDWRPSDDQEVRAVIGKLADHKSEMTGLPRKKVLGKIAALAVEEA